MDRISTMLRWLSRRLNGIRSSYGSQMGRLPITPSSYPSGRQITSEPWRDGEEKKINAFGDILGLSSPLAEEMRSRHSLPGEAQRASLVTTSRYRRSSLPVQTERTQELSSGTLQEWLDKTKDSSEDSESWIPLRESSGNPLTAVSYESFRQMLNTPMESTPRSSPLTIYRLSHLVTSLGFYRRLKGQLRIHS